MSVLTRVRYNSQNAKKIDVVPQTMRNEIPQSVPRIEPADISAGVREPRAASRIPFRRCFVQGTLDRSYLPEIIHSLHDSGETGILSLTRDKIKKRIYFGEGAMTFANSSFRGDQLGEFLVRNGKMTRSHLALASQKVTDTGRRLGETFVSMGVLTETEMEVGVAAQVLSIIYSVFPGIVENTVLRSTRVPSPTIWP